MRIFLCITLLAPIAGCAQSPPAPSKSSSKPDAIPEAKDVVSRYLKAATEQDGKQVIQTLSKDTFAAWDRILDVARYANEKELKSESLYVQSSVLWIREKFHTELKDLSGKDYLRLSFSRGYNSKQVLRKILQQTENFDWIVERTGEDIGIISFNYVGSWHPLRGLQMINTSDGWKIDGVDQIAVVADRIETRWKESGRTKTEYLSSLFQITSGRSLSPEDWRPPFKRTASESKD